MSELEARLEDESREFTDMELFRRRLKEEMEDERDQYQKDLAERDFTIDQTRQKYQAELLQLSEGGHFRMFLMTIMIFFTYSGHRISASSR